MKNRIHLFNSLNNAEASSKSSLIVDYSKFSLSFLQILQEAGFIKHWHLIKKKTSAKKNCFSSTKNSDGFKLEENEIKNLTELKLKIYLKKTNNFSNLYPKPFFKISPLSKSSRPIYTSYMNLWKLDRGLSLYILSSSIGLITDRQARQYKIGGEMICKIQSF